MKTTSTRAIVITALLSAIGVAIPMFSPVKFVLGPASMTLGSHIAIFIAMFLSPGIAVAVSLITALGFFLGGFPIVIVARAVTHVVFAFMGALILKKTPGIMKSFMQLVFFSLAVAAGHAICEVFAVIPFYFGNQMAADVYARGFMTSVVLLVGGITVLHSMIDFWIALPVWKALQLQKRS